MNLVEEQSNADSNNDGVLSESEITNYYIENDFLELKNAFGMCYAMATIFPEKFPEISGL